MFFVISISQILMSVLISANYLYPWLLKMADITLVHENDSKSTKSN